MRVLTPQNELLIRRLSRLAGGDLDMVWRSLACETLAESVEYILHRRRAK